LDIREKISDLERFARQLDPAADQRHDWLAACGNYAQSFLDALPQTKTYARDSGRNGFTGFPLQEAPADLGELLNFFRREVDTTGILPASGGQMGYIPGGGLFPSALGDFLADISNRYSGVSFAGPGAARMEGALVEWMCRLVGYPQTAAGDLTSGGSMATLSALVVARDVHGIGPAEIPDSCIYLTRQAHHCIGTALHVAGLGSVRKRIVPMDQRYRLDVAGLERMIGEDLEQGLRPWLAIGSAGTTDTGAIDPVDAIADVAGRHGLWFHLDAAYGGFFLLCEEGRQQLGEIRRADSIVMDPHKGLGIPYGTGAVLVKQGRLLAESFSYYADYMQDAKHTGYDPEAEYAPADYSPELTRPFRGPRLWFPLKLFGLAPFRSALSEKIWLARYFHEQISAMPGFEAGPYPDLSIVTFRYRPQEGEANDFNRRLLAAVHEDGKVFITSTLIDGVFTLRLAVLNFRTHLEQVDYLLGLLRRKARELDRGE
jgi:glutamate/tyrosine decarboxylase-like PLP-dependent enzyme